jgi:DNA (cytosine-5)-methyltransferase 1
MLCRINLEHKYSARTHAQAMLRRRFAEGAVLVNNLTSIEMCAGAGGQSLGLEMAGFSHRALVEIDPQFASTLKLNRPRWNVYAQDLRNWAKEHAKEFKQIDLVAGGLPCPPFSIAGKQLGANDERNLFPTALEIIETISPKAVLIENVRGFLGAVFEDYRLGLKDALDKLGYVSDWKLINASDFGVPQLRPRVVIVAYRKDVASEVEWPQWEVTAAPKVGDVLFDLIGANGWRQAKAWRKQASEIAPTIVGGSTKHGGPDLGPTRAKQAWKALGVDGHGVADAPPARDFVGMPKLTNRMVARLQGFPDHWQFSGKKTAAYRQIGNAFPPPVAMAVGLKIRSVIEAAARKQSRTRAAA